MPRAMRRALARELAAAPTIPEVRSDLSRFRRLSIIEAAAASAHLVPPVILGRVVREAAAIPDRGRATMTSNQFVRVARRLQNVADARSFDLIGKERLHDVALTRMMADSLPFNSRPHLSIHRVLGVLLDPVGPSLLDEESWTTRLGVPLKKLLLGSMSFQNRPPGYFDLAGLQHEPMSEDLRSIIDAAVQALSTPLEDISYQPRDGGDDPYQLGPLVSTPLIRVGSDRILIPSPPHVALATSFPALYIRLVREDAKQDSRDRTDLAGQRFGRYLIEYARAALPAQSWQVRLLDDEPSIDGEIADIAIWPNDQSFMVVLEGKTTLSTVAATLGDPAKREQARAFYQKSFDQVANTVRSVGRPGFLAGAPSGVPVFGFTVTADLHLTSVIDGTTYFGLVLDYWPPGDQGARCDDAIARVISSDRAEMLVDALAVADSAEALQLLNAIALGPTPLTAVPAAIKASALHERLVTAPLNPMVSSTISRLADGLSDPALREGLERVFAV